MTVSLRFPLQPTANHPVNPDIHLTRGSSVAREFMPQVSLSMKFSALVNGRLELVCALSCGVLGSLYQDKLSIMALESIETIRLLCLAMVLLLTRA